jgi:hypothetical protein
VVLQSEDLKTQIVMKEADQVLSKLKVRDQQGIFQ